MRGFQSGSTPSVLLVHGAFADASCWAGVVRQLRAGGLDDVVATANPLRSLACDAVYLTSIAALVDGPVLLVGHAYGGAVITVAGAAAPNVVGLVYVAGFALEAGESCADMSARFPDTLLGPSLRPATYRTRGPEQAVELYLRIEAFRGAAAADVPAEDAELMARTQRPVTAAALEAPAMAAAWRTMPSRYVVATADRVVEADAQRFMAARAGSTVRELDASHAVVVSQPAAVAEQIALAVTARAIGAAT